ncbi:UNVERIFIED_CONTAM: hypothetical protein HDU68_009539 [Siphonaria sp. JEL0065]|nr:hypothetical protein HDU68_009539 [Siphonaria sp. JEL0065]
MIALVNAISVIILLTGGYLIHMYIAAYRRTNALRKLNPTLTIDTVIVSPGSILTYLDLLPSWLPIKFPANWHYNLKYQGLFRNTQSDVIAMCDANTTNIYIANPDLCREIMVNRYKEFVKPVHHYAILDVFGRSILSTEGDEWRKHRKIAAPTFSEQNNLLVYEASLHIASEMFQSWEQSMITREDGSRTVLVNVSSDMMEFALSVISSAAFGIDIPWHEVADATMLKKGYTLTFKQALEIVVARMGAWVSLPRFLYYLPSKYLNETRAGFHEFGQYLDAIIDDDSVFDKPKNLLQMLSKAAKEEKIDAAKLSRSELKGNSFFFLLAGHETTAGTLTFALGLLALHQEKQETLFNKTKQAIGDATLPQYIHFPKLKYALAVMNETLRLFPPVINIPKYSSTETLSLGPFVFPPHTLVTVSTPGLHFNPRIWGSDVHTFRPERFLGDEEDEGKGTSRLGFAPFSEGPRGCLGKKFAQVEFVFLLTLISLKYRVRVPEGVDTQRMLDAMLGITLRPTKPVTLELSPR